MKRLNLGCGSVRPDDWINADIESDLGLPEPGWIFDVRARAPFDRQLLAENEATFDYIVANHLLSCFGHWDLLGSVLPNIRLLLKPGGVFRALVPDAMGAFNAYVAGDRDWFPLGGDLPMIDERLCTFLPWFGESLSIFTAPYLKRIGLTAGFSDVRRVTCGETLSGLEGIADLDDRCAQALIVEMVR